MLRRTVGLTLAVVAALAAAAGALAPPSPRSAHAASTAENGTFRYLTKTLPGGSTNAEYVAQLVVANADGPVTFSVKSGSALTTGLDLDPLTGRITGRPTVVEQRNVTFVADDGAGTIELTALMKFNSSGGGGNGGAEFGFQALDAAVVGAPYSFTISLASGAGPFTYGAVGLPPGLTLNGTTGEISGTPTASGRFYTTLSIRDAGENNLVATVTPLVVLPEGSTVRITTTVLNNGEVGTPYCDTWIASDAQGAVRFGASGLPPGLDVAPATGVVSGTPTLAGTFTVLITAADSVGTATTNLTMIVAPSATNSLFWDPVALPTAFAGVSYSRQPPIAVTSQNGTTVSYSAIGLPQGIAIDATSGALSGTAVDVGEYPVTFRATDSSSGVEIEQTIDFLVLPPSGGDASVIAVNLWITSELLRVGRPGRDLWTGRCIYNADRRTDSLFDPATDGVALTLGSRSITLDPGSLTGTPRLYRYRSPRGEKPVVSVNVSPSKQTIQWSSRSDTLTESLPSASRLTVAVDRGYRMDQYVDGTGRFRAPSGYRRTAYVVSGGSLVPGAAAAKGSANLSILLGDPAFAYEAGVSTLRIRVLRDGAAVIDRDFTALGTASESRDRRTGLPVVNLRTARDAETVNRVVRCTYSTKSGRMSLRLAGLDLTTLTDPEVHLGVELTIGERTHWTGVTFFAKRGRYSTVR